MINIFCEMISNSSQRATIFWFKRLSWIVQGRLNRPKAKRGSAMADQLIRLVKVMFITVLPRPIPRFSFEPIQGDEIPKVLLQLRDRHPSCYGGENFFSEETGRLFRRDEEGAEPWRPHILTMTPRHIKDELEIAIDEYREDIHRLLEKSSEWRR